MRGEVPGRRRRGRGRGGRRRRGRRGRRRGGRRGGRGGRGGRRRRSSGRGRSSRRRRRRRRSEAGPMAAGRRLGPRGRSVGPLGVVWHYCRSGRFCARTWPLRLANCLLTPVSPPFEVSGERIRTRACVPWWKGARWSLSAGHEDRAGHSPAVARSSMT